MMSVGKNTLLSVIRNLGSRVRVLKWQSVTAFAYRYVNALVQRMGPTGFAMNEERLATILFLSIGRDIWTEKPLVAMNAARVFLKSKKILSSLAEGMIRSLAATLQFSPISNLLDPNLLAPVFHPWQRNLGLQA